VVECHNVFPHERTPLDRVLLRFALSVADHVITHSTSDRDQLLRLIPGKTVSVSQLPTLDEFRKPGSRARDGQTAMFFGKVRRYKGLKILLKAMPSVLKRTECQLLVVGEFYESIDEYRRLIKELGIGDNVRIDNRYVSNEEVPAIFDLADVLVLPYLSATQSGVARIALSNGLPIIASRTGGLAELVIEDVNGLLFPPGDSEALADKMVDYFISKRGPVFAGNIISAPQEGQCTIVETIERFARA
jgi:glycosyltransferase involved in cell wall biosynthesis